MLFMEQAIINNYPNICNKPYTIKEIEKITHSPKANDSCGYYQISIREHGNDSSDSIKCWEILE
jgi:hypothetical protein